MKSITTTTSASEELAGALNAAVPSAQIAEVLAQALAATVTNRAGVVEPDWRTRVQATSLILSYKVGKPVERQQVITQTIAADPVGEVEARLAKSPALLKDLQRIVKTRKTELLFMALFLRMLQTGGRAAVIVPGAGAVEWRNGIHGLLRPTGQ